MIVHLTTMEAVPDPVYVGVDDYAAEMGDVMRFLASEMGCPEPPDGGTWERVRRRRGRQALFQ